MNEQLQVNVVILAAGLGTRMKSKRAKVLHRAGGLTLVEQVVQTCSTIASPKNITVVVGHQADQVRATLAPWGVHFIDQKEQRGTGHALMVCRHTLEPQSGQVLVLYGDCPLIPTAVLQKLVDHQTKSHAAATLIAAHLPDPTGYGRVIVSKSGEIEAVVEQKAATPQQLKLQLINAGIYCFDAKLLWKHIVEIQTNNPAHEYYLTDMVEILRRAGHTVDALQVANAEDLLGINTRAELAAADKIFRDRKVRELMTAGVTIEKPETVTIDSSVQIGIDSIVGPFAQLLGHTEIGEDCRIGACSIVENSRLASQVHVAPFTSIADSTVASGAHIGPFARLRGGAHIGQSVHIGNFVEVKNSELHEGVKASHLAYLGDAEIGNRTNIGAGTITCNFDGAAKHRTTIGQDAFIGSNSTLVAPIEIGEGSYIAAGSVITSEVPPDALAFGRSRQVVKEGWAAKKKKK